MRLGFIGLTHLGQTMMAAAESYGMKTFDLRKPYATHTAPDIIFLSRDIEDGDFNDDVVFLHSLPWPLCPTVIVSQVVPGTTRRAQWAASGQLYYQVDTIIMNRALERATHPEQIIVGCEDKRADLAPAYANYCLAFGCPILKMGYESAEFTKLAINYHLAAQVAASIALDDAAATCGADWNEVIPALRNDARIGKHAYLEPGPKIGGHIPRDVHRIGTMLWPPNAYTAAIEALCE